MAIESWSLDRQFRMRPLTRRRSNAFTILYTLALLALLAFVVFQARNVWDKFWLEFLLFFSIGALSIYGQILSLRREASIHFVSFLFCYLFMSIAPVVQIGADVDPIFTMNNWVFWAAVNALCFTAIGVFKTYQIRPLGSSVAQSRKPVPPSVVNYAAVFLVTVLLSGIAIVLFRNVLFTNREAFSEATSQTFSDPIVALIAGSLLLSTPFFGALIGLRHAIGHRKGLWVILFSFALAMATIVNNPLIHPRYQLAGLAFFALDYMFYGRKTRLLAVFLILGVLMAPAFQAFRYQDNAYADPESNDLFGTTFLSMDYDAFRMSCYTLLTVHNDGIAWGSNLIGSALFFVPRAIWESKPPPTAWVVFETADHSVEVGTNNLSTPLMAEGYFAFGWIGALSIAFAFWWGISKVTLLSRKDPYSWMFMLRCLFTGLALIFLRGTLTVGVSAVAGTFVAMAIPALLIRHRFS